MRCPFGSNQNLAGRSARPPPGGGGGTFATVIRSAGPKYAIQVSPYSGLERERKNGAGKELDERST